VITLEEHTENLFGKAPEPVTRENAGEDPSLGSSILEEQPVGSSVLTPEPEVEEPEVEEEAQPDEDVQTEPENQGEFSYDDYLKEQARANAMHQQTTALRHQQRELKEEMANLRKLNEDALAAFKREQVPDEIANDPTIQYLEQMVEQKIAPLREAIPEPVENPSADAHMYGVQSVQNFQRVQPKFQEARAHARTVMAKQRGIENDPNKEQILDSMEIELNQVLFDKGVDSASFMWDFARQNGYAPESRPAVPRQTQKVTRIKAGLSESEMADIKSEPPSRDGTISMKEFYERYPANFRQKLFMRNQEAFEELQMTQRISMRHLQ
jgi:hypothetical protein